MDGFGLGDNGESWGGEPLGLDSLYIANEGKLVAIVPEDTAQRLLQVMQIYPLGREAAFIGRVIEDDHCFVRMATTFGGTRIVDWLAAKQLPRIC